MNLRPLTYIPPEIIFRAAIMIPGMAARIPSTAITAAAVPYTPAE